eukprot:10012906-Ditylum_brightwellii.AAC.1
MGRSLDVLKNSLLKTVEQPILIHNRECMINIIAALSDEMSDFKDFLKHKFEIQKTKVVDSKINMKAIFFAVIRNELFCPTNIDNRKSTSTLDHLAPTVATVIINDMMDQKKATYKYLSYSGSKYSWDHGPPQHHKTCLGKIATKDVSERPMKIDDHMFRPLTKKDKETKKSNFFISVKTVGTL